MKIHMVKKGDTLYEIAQKYDVDLDKLIEANPQIADPNAIEVGMKVKIPISPKSLVPATDYLYKHVVVQGDTLWKLGKAWNVPLQEMIEANPHLKNPNVLMTGDVIYIPKLKSQTPPQSVQPSQEMQSPQQAYPNPNMPESSAIPNAESPAQPMPETLVPEMKMPEMPMPETPVPEMTMPEMSTPGTPMPETTMPEMSTPGTPVPEMPMTSPEYGTNLNMPKPPYAELPAEYPKSDANYSYPEVYQGTQTGNGAAQESYTLPHMYSGMKTEYTAPAESHAVPHIYSGMKTEHTAPAESYDIPQTYSGMKSGYGAQQESYALPHLYSGMKSEHMAPAESNAAPQTYSGMETEYAAPLESYAVPPTYSGAQAQPSDDSESYTGMQFEKKDKYPAVQEPIHHLFNQYPVSAVEVSNFENQAWQSPPMPAMPEMPSADQMPYNVYGLNQPEYPSPYYPQQPFYKDCGCGGPVFPIYSEGIPYPYTYDAEQLYPSAEMQAYAEPEFPLTHTGYPIWNQPEAEAPCFPAAYEHAAETSAYPGPVYPSYGYPAYHEFPPYPPYSSYEYPAHGMKKNCGCGCQDRQDETVNTVAEADTGREADTQAEVDTQVEADTKAQISAKTEKAKVKNTKSRVSQTQEALRKLLQKSSRNRSSRIRQSKKSPWINM